MICSLMRSGVKKLQAILFFAGILTAAAGIARSETSETTREGNPFLTWPLVGSGDSFRLPPLNERRVGFTLPHGTRGQRVVVAVRAFIEAEAPSGYHDHLFAVDVNGEVIGLKIGPRPRLLNRPVEFHFGPDGGRTMSSGREGRLGLIENQGSARWTVPYTPSIKTWLASENYAPADLEDPGWIVLEITDAVHPGSYNYVTIKNEADSGILHCEAVSIHYEPDEFDRLQQVYRELKEKYFGRSAVVRESSEGREWVYDMDLVDNSHGGSGSMAEIQTLDDARAIVEPLKEQGYTAIIVSGLHMRYSYPHYWESRIVPYMKYLGRAAREAGMKIIDHYDVPIFYSGGYPFLLSDDHLEWTQRDIRYGTPTRMYCINNPDFREHFFDFTRRIQRESGIDGYQIDEAYFFDGNFCGCIHCRTAFTETSGFTLPREADSPVLFNNNHPLWRLFLLWRVISMQQFKKDFLASIHQENPAAILSVYTTSHYYPAKRGGAWGNMLVSYANGKEGVTRAPMHDYRYGLADFKITTGVADALDHASWMLWYPLTRSAARFCWGLSQASGCAQWHSKTWTSSIKDLIRWPHQMINFDFESHADVGVVFSENSKDASLWSGAYHGMEVLGWGEAMIEHNLQHRILHEIAITAEQLARYPVILLPQMTIIDEANHRSFETYVREGGTLVVTGETGMRDELGRPRADFLLGDMMNVRFKGVLNTPFEIVEDAIAFKRDDMLYHYGAQVLDVAVNDPAKSRVIRRWHKDGTDYPGVVETRYGKGRVITVAAFLGVSNVQLGIQEGSKPIFKTHPEAPAFIASLLREILGDNESISAERLPPGIVYTSWVRKKGGEINIHFLNVSDYRPLGPDEPAKRRKIEFPLVDEAITLRLRGERAISGARFYAPDQPDAAPCTVEATTDGSRITIPGGKMTMYGLLKIYCEGPGGPA